jgi:predicted short-subunit dehydrogenase-like oxidoreductase (DUF2520 family)
MTALPSISIVGSGSLACVLAISLRKAGYRIDEIIVRDRASSIKNAKLLANKCKAIATTIADAQLKSDIIWFCISDDAITSFAQQFARRRDIEWRRKIAVHSSGALAAAALSPLAKRGAGKVSAHPMNSFVPTSIATLKNVPFALEGDLRSIQLVEKVIKTFGASSHKISAKNKVLYHAMGAFASPLYVSLIDLAVQVGRQAGVRDPLKVLALILRQTTENILQKGTAASFSGPIRRSDVDTLKKHLLALRGIPNARKSYLMLAQNALVRLPVKDRKSLEASLRK